MANIRQSLFQQPEERITSIKKLNKTICESKEVKEWDLDLSIEPDEIGGKILERPSILDPHHEHSKKLDDSRILNQLVHLPINFQKWAIFCLDRDIENGKYLQDKFYNLSQ